jgi:hypothetical protein
MPVLTRSVYYTGDRLPTITATLTDASGAPLTGFTGSETLQFAARGAYNTTNLFTATATWVVAAAATVRFDPGATDMPSNALPGIYDLFWIVTSAGKAMHIPAGQMELRRGI